MNDYQKCLYAALELIRTRKAEYICLAVQDTKFSKGVKREIVDYIGHLIGFNTYLDEWLFDSHKIYLTQEELREYRMMFILCLIEEVKDWKNSRSKFVNFICDTKVGIILGCVWTIASLMWIVTVLITL